VTTWPEVSVSLPERKVAKIRAVANDILARGGGVISYFIVQSQRQL
jgi:hypothetical protein